MSTSAAGSSERRSITRKREPVIRRATSAHFEVLVELDRSSGVHHAALDPGNYRLPDREAMAAFLRRRLADPDREVFVAVVGGVVVGMVDVTMIEDPDPGSIVRPVRTADLGISVLDGWQRQGIGRALMAAAEQSARRRGAGQVVLDMLAANADALRFYHSLGYEIHGLLLRRALG
jgi:ribosomal protein S18 acetylase RimI-like enzyme